MGCQCAKNTDKSNDLETNPPPKVILDMEKKDDNPSKIESIEASKIKKAKKKVKKEETGKIY